MPIKVLINVVRSVSVVSLPQVELPHHLERSACRNAPRVNRQAIYQALTKRDRAHLITNRTLEWEGHLPGKKYFDGTEWFWECHLCPRQFADDVAFENHVKSPVHAPVDLPLSQSQMPEAIRHFGSRDQSFGEWETWLHHIRAIAARGVAVLVLARQKRADQTPSSTSKLGMLRCT